jgi:pSer/pThr/pTyr-binding forkhead associated (FHA) protein
MSRRQEFRRVRENLVAACGQQTLAADQVRRSAPSAVNPSTLIRNQSSQIPARVQFVLVDKDYIYPLKVGLNTIGRMPDNDVVIADACVSRRHCAIVVHAQEGCELHDVASKNGTFLNGRRLSGPTPLTSGDEIGMCTRQLIFVCRDEVDADDSSRTHCE